MLQKTIKSLRFSKNQYNYLTPIDKPVSSLALQSIIECSTQLMYHGYIDYGFCAQISVVFGGILFRGALEFIGAIFANMKFKGKNRRINNLINKIFLVDCHRDIKFYQIKQPRISQMEQNYKPSELLKNFFQSYMMLNFLRGAHEIIVRLQFQSFCQHTKFLNSLQYHDPFFICPLIVMGLWFYMLANSRHAFLIHLSQPSNRLLSFNLAFMMGLAMVPLPCIYQLAIIGLTLGHLLIRSIKNKKRDLWLQFQELLKYLKR